MNNFFWYDVVTEDPRAAEAFYSAVMGWSAKPAEVGDPAYTVFSVGDRGVGGLMLMPEELRDTMPGGVWTGYIHVADVDAYVERILARGGSVFRRPWDLPDVGRLAVVLDPYGAAFMLMTPFGRETRSAIPPGTPGYVGWHELRSVDWENAFAFYADIFGWTKGEAVDMGPMGLYQIFLVDDTPVGGMCKTHDTSQPSAWLYYFNVASIDDAVARVAKHGGTVLIDPQPIPGGGWIAPCIDPQGAHFALLSSQR